MSTGSALGSTITLNSLSGGLPSVSQDLAPSIIFTILYVITTCLCLWRMVVNYRRPRRIFLAFLRLQAFEVIRVATMIVRAIGAENITHALNGTAIFSEGLLIAEQVLLSIGYLILANTLVKLTIFHDLRGDAYEGNNQKKRLTRLMELALLVAIILGIVSGAEYSKSLSDSTTAQTVQTYKKVSTIIVLIVVALLCLYNARLATETRLPRRTSLWLSITSLLLIIVPAYRLAQAFDPPSDAGSDGRKTEFYVLQITVEWLVGLSLLAVDAKEWCGVEDGPASEKGSGFSQSYLMQSRA